MWRVGVLVRGLAFDEGIEDREVVPADGDLVGGLDAARDREKGAVVSCADGVFLVGHDGYSWFLIGFLGGWWSIFLSAEVFLVAYVNAAGCAWFSRPGVLVKQCQHWR